MVGERRVVPFYLGTLDPVMEEGRGEKEIDGSPLDTRHCLETAVCTNNKKVELM